MVRERSVLFQVLVFFAVLFLIPGMSITPSTVIADEINMEEEIDDSEYVDDSELEGTVEVEEELEPLKSTACKFICYATWSSSKGYFKSATADLYIGGKWTTFTVGTKVSNTKAKFSFSQKVAPVGRNVEIRAKIKTTKSKTLNGDKMFLILGCSGSGWAGSNTPISCK